VLAVPLPDEPLAVEDSKSLRWVVFLVFGPERQSGTSRELPLKHVSRFRRDYVAVVGNDIRVAQEGLDLVWRAMLIRAPTPDERLPQMPFRKTGLSRRLHFRHVENERARSVAVDEFSLTFHYLAELLPAPNGVQKRALHLVNFQHADHVKLAVGLPHAEDQVAACGICERGNRFVSAVWNVRAQLLSLSKSFHSIPDSRSRNSSLVHATDVRLQSL